jgi:membrane-associated phospholipid phosphatase
VDVKVAALPNHPSRAGARKGTRRLLFTGPGRRAAGRGAAALVVTPKGRRAARRFERYARRTLDRVRWQPLLYVPAVVTFARLRRRLGPPPAPLTLCAVYGTPAVVAYALPRGRVRTYLTWLAHMWAYKVGFEVPHDRPEKQRDRLRIDAPIAIDRVIGLGAPPSQRLQRALRRTPELTLLDKLLTGIYAMWELEPHLALAWLLSRHPGRFPGAAVRLGLTYDSTLLAYFAVPTAPPWWASEIEGRMQREVRRVTVEVMRALQRKPRPGRPDDHVSGSNPWAAWPSDHFASSLSAAIALAEAEPRAGALAFGYAGALGFTLVYSGEHYAIDLILGAVLALAIHGAGTVLTDRRIWLLEAVIQPGPRWKRLSRLSR